MQQAIAFACLLVLSLIAFAGAQQSSLTPNPSQFLKVVVVPHSHCDPGWWFTFEDYHEMWTQRILDNIIAMLERDPARRFMFAEVSFLHRWWEQRNERDRARLRKVIADGQLELVTGGWVMHDEAVTHIDAQIAQLELGQRFLLRTFAKLPRAAWLIDPFGHSVTTALHYSRMHYFGAVLNRIHYRKRMEFAEKRKLEFLWQPRWSTGVSPRAGVREERDSEGTLPFASPLRVHVLPLGLYGVEHTCGDDIERCRTFKFAHVREGTPVNDTNEASRAAELAHMYRQKSKWHVHEHLLVPLGDDFKWKNLTKADWELSQWERLWRYINNHPEEFHMKVEMGSLGTYFERIASVALPKVYDSDLLPYEDVADAAWTGFYTSRPNLKNLIRSLSRALRSLQVADAVFPSSHERDRNQTEEVLERCGREHALAQHHDIITGTQRRAVAADGAARLVNCIRAVDQQLATVWPRKLPSDWVTARGAPPSSALASRRALTSPPYDPLPLWQQRSGARILGLWNSLGWDREEIVSVEVEISGQPLWVLDAAGVPVACQLDPLLLIDWNETEEQSAWQFSSDRQLLRFLAQTPALSSVQYLLTSEGPTGRECVRGVVEMYEPEAATSAPPLLGGWSVARGPGQTVSLTSYWRVSTETGLVQEAVSATGSSVLLNQKLLEYRNDGSGAYLMRLLRNHSRTLEPRAETVLLVRGALYVTAHSIWRDTGAFLGQTVGAETKRDGELDIAIHSCPGYARSAEWTVRWNIPKADSFWTDRNGYAGAYVQLRMPSRTKDEEPATKVRPMVSQSFATTSEGRVSLLTKSSRGVWMPHVDELEVFVTRQSLRDDGRGLAEPVQDPEPEPGFESPTCGPLELRLLVHPEEPSRAQIAFETPLAIALSAASHTAPSPTLRGMASELPHTVHIQSWQRCGEEHCIRLQHTADTTSTAFVATDALREGFSCHRTAEWLFINVTSATGRSDQACDMLPLNPLAIVCLRLSPSSAVSKVFRNRALIIGLLLLPFVLLVVVLRKVPAGSRHRLLWGIGALFRTDVHLKR